MTKAQYAAEALEQVYLGNLIPKHANAVVQGGIMLKETAAKCERLEKLNAELLEALQELLADKYLADPINADRMAKARAAIAKAKGE